MSACLGSNRLSTSMYIVALSIVVHVENMDAPLVGITPSYLNKTFRDLPLVNVMQIFSQTLLQSTVCVNRK